MLISEWTGLPLMILIAAIDLKYQKIPNLLLLGSSVLVGCFRIWHIGEPAFLWLTGSLIGMGFFILSRISKEAFGYGDSWVIFLLGVFLGLWKVISLLSIACFLSAVAAGICLIKSRWSRKRAIPFIPFLAIGYLGVLLF